MENAFTEMTGKKLNNLVGELFEVLGAGPQTFWDHLLLWGHLLLCINPVILSFLPSPQPRTVGLCVTRLRASLGLLPPALSCSMSPLSALRSWQVPAALGVFQKSAYQTSGLHPVRDFRVSKITSFFKQMEQKPFWFILITWRSTQWPKPGSTWRGILALEVTSLSLKRKSVLCVSNESWDSFLFSLVRSLQDNMYRATSGDWKHFKQQSFSLGVKTGGRWFPGSDLNQTKPTLQKNLARHSLASLPYLDC